MDLSTIIIGIITVPIGLFVWIAHIDKKRLKNCPLWLASTIVIFATVGAPMLMAWPALLWLESSFSAADFRGYSKILGSVIAAVSALFNLVSMGFVTGRAEI